MVVLYAWIYSTSLSTDTGSRLLNIDYAENLKATRMLQATELFPVAHVRS
jgi:hypothetical protein